MTSLINNASKKARKFQNRLYQKVMNQCAKVSDKLNDKKGGVTMVEIVGIIVVVLAILILVFFPFLKDWFENTLAPMFKDLTQKLFSLAG